MTASALCPTHGSPQLRRELGLTPTGKRSCAVVGSADILHIGPAHGKEIDSHDLVWRINNAPTASFERIVGSRTSFRVVNHVPIDKWVLRATNRSALLRTVDGAEYESLQCRSGEADAVEMGCVLSLVNSQPHFSKTAAAYRRLYPSHQLIPMSGALQRAGNRCSSQLGGNAPSGGLLTVLLALAVCDSPVSLFGFWPFCCKPHRGLPAMNYKYSQGNRTAWVCCSRGRERMEVEFAFYERLHHRRLVTLHTVPALHQPRVAGHTAPLPRGMAGEVTAATDRPFPSSVSSSRANRGAMQWHGAVRPSTTTIGPHRTKATWRSSKPSSQG